MMTSLFVSRAPVRMTAMMVMMMSTMVTGVKAVGTNTNQTMAQEFLDLQNREAQVVLYTYKQLNWAYNTNITVVNQHNAVQGRLQMSLWLKNMSRLAREFNTTDFPPDMQRQFHKIMDIGPDAMKNESKLRELSNIAAQMGTLYSTAQVCLQENKCLPLEPDIYRTFETSRDEDLLRRLWVGWRDASGKKIRQLYSQYVSLINEAIQESGYRDMGDYWRSGYETETFAQDIAALFEELRPLYEQLHAYVRRRLKKHYGDRIFPSSGHIPAHLLGNNWAQQWNNLQDLLMPYPNKPSLDITDEMVKQGYTATTIFEVADDFFTSLGLEPVPQEFWNKSMLVKPVDGRQVVCHASAWNFYNGSDFRVKQCTEVTMDHFTTAHHEMGHIEYYLLYKHRPVVYRDGANPGFHEAVGDTISLSVETPRHLYKIGLLPSLVQDNEADLNFLMAMALQKIAFLPFGYLIDQWRWSVFSGTVTPDNYTKAWWDLRCNLQGVSPPVNRTEDDFDPGAKYHVANNYDYISYFVSYIIQFQFHKALCEAAGHQGPLHTCDIYNSTAAGNKLHDMLSKGSSQVWTVPFQAMTGTTKMSAQPLIGYFQPLIAFLQQENRQDVGWSKGCPVPVVTGHAGHVSFSALILILMALVTAMI